MAAQASRKAPFAKQIPRAVKAAAGRTAASETPLHVRAIGLEVDDPARRRIRDRFGRKLGKFAPRIERATVRFEDVNGPRGGKDTVCRIKVVLSHLPSVMIEETRSDVMEAFDVAVEAAERAVRRTLGRSAVNTPTARARGRQARAKAPTARPSKQTRPRPG
jgi:ribosome-associated translation inhibitor RaiA